jgi:tetratricopeptide (TPR) repeat protein
MSQAQMLFPKSQYPIHSAYIDLFTTMISRVDSGVTESDIEILSIALGDKAHQLFKTVIAKAGVTDKLNSLMLDALQLKIENKNRLTAKQSELPKGSNKAVVELILLQYKVKPNEIEIKKRLTTNQIVRPKIANKDIIDIVTPKSQSKPGNVAVGVQQTILQQQPIVARHNLTAILQSKNQENDVKTLRQKKIIQIKQMFPPEQYPKYRQFIDFLIQYSTNDPLHISADDMENISAAFGTEELNIFRSISDDITIEEKIKHIGFNGLQLKISIRKRLNDTNLELSKDANLAVIKDVIGRYQVNINAIEVKIRQELQEKEQAKKVELLRLKEQSEIERKKHFSDFPAFGIKNILKDSAADILLNKLMKKQISQDEKKWLDNERITNDLVEKKYHLQLAHNHYQNWKQKSLPWELVNASAAYRKAEELTKIKKALDESYPFNIPKKEKKLKSALLTTYGGVCRDLKDYVNSIKLGLEAHNVTPLNFRPCTLLGAVYLSTGEFDLGHEWYGKAKERGFSQDAYDNDIKSVYFRASAEMKNRLKQNLISTGHSYKWLTDSK